MPPAKSSPVKDPELAVTEQPQKSGAVRLLVLFGRLFCIFLAYKAYKKIIPNSNGLSTLKELHGPAHHMTMAQREKLYL
jgi:hypothetical protein